MSLLSELKRRNVIRAAVLYLVAGWVIMQVAQLLFGVLELPEWSARFVLGLVVLGFPIALILSWVYELTPEGLKRAHEVAHEESITAATGRKMNILVAVLLAVAIGLLLADRFRGPRVADGDTRAGAAADVAGTESPRDAAKPRRPAGSAAAASIAVLPFVNMSDDKANDYFSDGLSEELLNVLAKVQGLRVIARTSSFAFKGKDVTIEDVARVLSVDHVLEGSVRKSGKRVRITAQLIRATDSSHLWSETYDRTLEDVFAVQDEISGEVVDALKVRLLGSQPIQAEIGGTDNPKAYEASLRGLYLRNQGQKEDTLRAALAAYDLAIAEDPKYARAHSGRAATLSLLASNGYEPFAEGFARAREAALRAAELAPDLGDAYLTLGYVANVVDNDVEAARAHYDRAVALDPGSAEVQTVYASFAIGIGRADEAIAASSKAVQLDPIAARPHTALANAYYGARRFAEAEAVARRAILLEPNYPGVHGGLGLILLETGKAEEARAEIEKEPIEWQRLTWLALADARLGHSEIARAELATAIERLGDAAAYQYAQVNAHLGDHDAAFRWLETARRIKDPGLSTIISDPLLDPLRKDPRFERFLRELGVADAGRSG
ncbi:MAG TPA: tetratricopeptide repeat protein [Steroidobacteraceae bacterium]